MVGSYWESGGCLCDSHHECADFLAPGVWLAEAVLDRVALRTMVPRPQTRIRRRISPLVPAAEIDLTVWPAIRRPRVPPPGRRPVEFAPRRRPVAGAVHRHAAAPVLNKDPATT